MKLQYTRHNGIHRYFYRKNGQIVLHRIDGPAYINKGATKYESRQQWLIHGICHNFNGPALTYMNGQKLFCLFGNDVSYDAFKEITATKDPVEIAIEMMNIYGSYYQFKFNVILILTAIGIDKNTVDHVSLISSLF